jgi:ABC-type glycerol-3-phosphate transport system substrate-binding protein
MNHTLRRILCLVLVLFTAATAGLLSVACSEPTPDESGNSNIGSDGTSNTTDDIYAAYNIPDSLPSRSFGNDTFTIVCQDEGMIQFFFVDDMDGSVVDKAVYKSVSAVEERFEVDVSAYTVTNHQVIRNGITTQDGSFDFAFMLDVTSSGYSLENLFVNLYDLEHLDFSKPWWPAPSVEALTFQDKMYLGSSTMSYLGLGQTFLVYFNKTLFDDNGIDYPYETVFNGEWYMEDMIEIAENFYTDTQPNSIKDPEDVYGFLAPSGFYGWFESFGIEMVKKDGDDLVLNAHCQEAYDLIEYAYEMIVEKDMGYIDAEATVNDMFAQGQSTFIYGKLRAAYDVFRFEDINYGMLPVPKLNEDQQTYHSAYTDRYFVVPSSSVSGKDEQDIGFILEALSAEGYRTIYPAYYEVAMQGRYSKDAESKRVLTMLHPLRVIDFAYVYTGDQCFSRSLYKLISEQSKDYASLLGSGTDTANDKLASLVATFKELN